MLKPESTSLWKCMSKFMCPTSPKWSRAKLPKAENEVEDEEGQTDEFEGGGEREKRLNEQEYQTTSRTSRYGDGHRCRSR